MFELKGIVHSEMKSVSLFSHPRVFHMTLVLVDTFLMKAERFLSLQRDQNSLDFLRKSPQKSLKGIVKWIQ